MRETGRCNRDATPGAKRQFDGMFTKSGTSIAARAGLRTGIMADTTRDRRLVYVPPADMELWRCRPLANIDVLDLQDRHVGRFDGLIIDAQADRPLFLVIQGTGGRQAHWWLVPVGDAWFDQTARAIRVDVNLRSGEPHAFNPAEFDRMTENEAAEYERRVLAQCCPEVGIHRDGTPDYGRHAAFQCPTWLRPTSPQHATDSR